jgi:hypothetical protein
MSHKPTLGMRRPRLPRASGLEQYPDTAPFGTSDQVLACCFGLDRDASAGARINRTLVVVADQWHVPDPQDAIHRIRKHLGRDHTRRHPVA